MTKLPPLRIDIVSDVVCPWCIIGYKEVMKAVTMLETPMEAETYWHPFELNRDMAEEGENMRDHIARKYGATPEQGAANRRRLSEMGESLGFRFNFGDDMRIYNSFKAHKLLAMAVNESGWQVQTAIKLALFKAYFQDGRNISDMAILLEIAAEQGMDVKAVEDNLGLDGLSQLVRAEQDQWIDKNVTAVPALVFDRKYMVPGAQTAEVYVGLIGKVLAKRAAA